MPGLLRTLVPLGLVAAFVVAGCSTGTARVEAPVRVVPATEAVEMLASRTVIDVRTPGEFAGGHVVGALNIPVESSDFGARIEALDKDAPYLVYCRSGRRSAIAAQAMAEASFTDIVDAGGLEALARAGAAIE